MSTCSVYVCLIIRANEPLTRQRFDCRRNTLLPLFRPLFFTFIPLFFYSIWPIDTVSLSPHSRLPANLYRLNMLLMQFLKVSPVSASKVCVMTPLFFSTPLCTLQQQLEIYTHTRSCGYSLDISYYSYQWRCYCNRKEVSFQPCRRLDS